MTHSGTKAVLAVATLVLCVGCGSDPPVPGTTPGNPTSSGTGSSNRSPEKPTAVSSATPDQDRRPSSASPATAEAVVGRVPPTQWSRIVDAGMVRPECPIQHRAQLRRIDVNHLDFRGDVRRGHLIVNRDVARSVARIFTRLFEARFPIRRMRSLEYYGGENTKSLRDDNTASFNCRIPEENNAPYTESPHANGRAIDINPRENPWRDLRCDCWSPSPRFANRTRGEGKILRGGVVWRAFTGEGWIWQDIDVPDYMHFDTGYPSTSFRGRS